MKLQLLCFLCIVCVVVAGCGQHHGEVTFQTDGITQTVRQGQIALRTDFPLPIYPNSQPSGSVSATTTSNLHHEEDKYLMLFSNDNLSQIEDFYRNALSHAGWTVKKTQEFSDMVNITAQKADQEAGVMLTRNQERTTISLSVSRADTGTQASPSRPAAGTTAGNKLNLPDD